MRKLIIFSLFGLLGFSTLAKTPEQKGYEIAQKMQSAAEGFIGESSTMQMVLIDAYGTKIIRDMKGKTLEVKDDGDKSLSTFLSPQDVKGTKMLTWAHKDKDDDQWLYLPSFRRTKRIKSSSKSSSFMASEFSFEDLGSQEIEKYNYKWIRDDKTKSGKTLWVVERTAKDKKYTGYSKNIMWVSPKLLSPIKVEYYDRKSELLKVSSISDFKAYKVKGKTLYRAGKIHMKNVQTKKQSIFIWKDRKIGVKHPVRVFRKNALK